jgi:molybdate transport system ATP-binding protein
MTKVNISKTLQFSIGKQELLVNVVLEENTITSLYGESGAGKTTLLKIMAGFIKPETGFITINDTVWLDIKQHINLPPQQRSIGFVFQDYALFPNMTVLQNLHYAAGKKKDDAFIQHLIEIVSLQSFLHTKPAQLSGGQQQRVALIRALVQKPQLLLLDEPLSAVDTTLRQSLHTALQQLHRELKFTALLVSHDVGEVYALAKNIIHLQQGAVIFRGTPQQLFGASSLSSKLQMPAEVLAIIPNGIIYIVELLAATNIIKITATSDEVKNLKVGDQVLIYAKAFHVGMRKMK